MVDRSSQDIWDFDSVQELRDFLKGRGIPKERVICYNSNCYNEVRGACSQTTVNVQVDEFALSQSRTERYFVTKDDHDFFGFVIETNLPADRINQYDNAVMWVCSLECQLKVGEEVYQTVKKRVLEENKRYSSQLTSGLKSSSSGETSWREDMGCGTIIGLVLLGVFIILVFWIFLILT